MTARSNRFRDLADVDPTGLVDGQVFVWNAAQQKLLPGAGGGGGGPTGPAGGKLSGTYPNPGLNAASTDLSDSAALARLASPTFTGTTTAPEFSASGLTGATAASRYVGATASGAPVSGTFAVGDFVIDQTAAVWVCTVLGTPGTWVKAGAGGSPAMPINALIATPAAGKYLTSQFFNGVFNGAGPASLGDMFALPVIVPAAHTYVGIAQQVWTAGAAGSVCRMGIYSDSGQGTPGALLLDAGTINSTVNALDTVTISQALPVGLVWLVCVPQVAMPTFVAAYAQNGGGAPFGLAGNPGGTAGGMSNPPKYWYVASVNGALPASPAWTVSLDSNQTRIPYTGLLA